MSAWCNKIIIPAVSSHYHHPCRRRSLPSIFKHLATTTSPPEPIKASPNRRRRVPISATLPHSPQLQSLSPLQREQVSLYANALLQWNQRMNLTAVTEESEVMTRHVEDSLAIVPPLRRAYLSHCTASSSLDELNLIDVGSGAGLPGLILAIAHPGWKVTLLESMQKRCFFLEHIIGLVGLSNVQILCERAEDAGQSIKFREKFDVAVARAVAEMRILAEYCLPLVRVGGLFLAAKGYNPQEEVNNAENAIKLMGASILELCSVESHGPLGKRTAVVCLKDHATPRKYPRHSGFPSKNPL